MVTDPNDDEQEFEGVYVEDGGITTDWCGELIASTRPDVLHPTVERASELRPGRQACAPALLRLGRSQHRARPDDRSGAAGKVVGSVTSPLRRVNGQPSFVLWRPRKRLSGTFVLCARAWDRYGNASARSCSTLRLK